MGKKEVEFYSGTLCVQLCYSGYNWLTGLYALNKEAENLRTDARRICKAVGVHDEFHDYDVSVVFPEHKIIVSVGGTRETCEKIVTEARKRRFKLTIGKECFKFDAFNKAR